MKKSSLDRSFFCIKNVNKLTGEFMKFLKYTHRWASGHETWEYKLLTYTDEVDEDVLEEQIDTMENENSWSDKYRGIKYEIVDYPGHEWMKKSIRQCKYTLKSANKRLGEFNALYYKNGGT